MRKHPVSVTSPRRAKLSSPSKTDGRGLPSGKHLTGTEIVLLRDVAGKYPFVFFGVYQLAAIMEIHPEIITAVANHPNSPFLHATKKARPEEVATWLRTPPKDFLTTRK